MRETRSISESIFKLDFCCLIFELNELVDQLSLMRPIKFSQSELLFGVESERGFLVIPANARKASDIRGYEFANNLEIEGLSIISKLL